MEALQEVLDDACPGTKILIRPGHYSGRIVVGPETAGRVEEPIIVMAEKGLGSVTIDGAGAMITWKFNGSSFVHLKDLQITGGGYHGIFFDHGSNHIKIENNRVFDNHRVQPMTSHAEIKGSGGGSESGLRNIVLRGNEIFHSVHPSGSNFQGIDCNFCTQFHVLENYIHDIKRPTSFEYSYYDRGSCIQFKSTSDDIVIEGNLIERCHIGIVLGGEGLASPENISGIVRNNMVTDSEDIGLAIVNARDFQVYDNRIAGTEKSIVLAEDRNFPEGTNTGIIKNNEMSHDLLGIEDFDVQIQGNQVFPLRSGVSLDRQGQ
jgi:nitrous oxidase accessory protein NosD